MPPMINLGTKKGQKNIFNPIAYCYSTMTTNEMQIIDLQSEAKSI